MKKVMLFGLLLSVICTSCQHTGSLDTVHGEYTDYIGMYSRLAVDGCEEALKARISKDDVKKEKRTREAVADSRKSHASVSFLLAINEAYAGEYTVAHELIETAVAIWPENIEIVIFRMHILKKLGRKDFVREAAQGLHVKPHLPTYIHALLAAIGEGEYSEDRGGFTARELDYIRILTELNQ